MNIQYYWCQFWGIILVYSQATMLETTAMNKHLPACVDEDRVFLHFIKQISIADLLSLWSQRTTHCQEIRLLCHLIERD